MRTRAVVALFAVLAVVAPSVAEDPPPVEASGAMPISSSGLFWARADYLVAWLRGADLPPLVTTSPPGTPKSLAGVLGASDTTTLFGGGINNGARNGFRLEAGYWLGADPTLGFEAGFMMLETRSRLFSASSDTTPIIARPFLNPLNGLQDAVLVAFPGSSTGDIAIRASSENFYSAYFDLTENFVDTGWLRVNSLVGYRYVRYDEGMRFRQNVFPTDPKFVPGTQITSTDEFATKNEFHGCDMGVRLLFQRDAFSLDVLAKLAVGSVLRDTLIRGEQVTTVPGAAPVTLPGGVLALESNSGQRGSRDWTVVPEVAFTGGWQINDSLRLRLGYSVIWFDRIVRAGDRINTTINPNLFPPSLGGDPQTPPFELKRSDIWVHSFNFGVEFTY